MTRQIMSSYVNLIEMIIIDILLIHVQKNTRLRNVVLIIYL